MGTVEMEETLSRELHEVAGPAGRAADAPLPSHASNGGQPSRRAWEPPLVAAATIVVLAVVGLLALQEGGHDPQPAPPRACRLQAPPSHADGPRGSATSAGSRGSRIPPARVPRTGRGDGDPLRRPGGGHQLHHHDLNFLVVHQQDIRSVVNAMWKAGAIAVTVQANGWSSTAEITCEGNAIDTPGACRTPSLTGSRPSATRTRSWRRSTATPT